MKIKKAFGRMFDGDQIIKIKTDDFETFEWADLFLVINVATINELKRMRSQKYSYDLIKAGKPVFFIEAVNDAIRLAKMGVDLTNPDNERDLKEFCVRNRIQNKFEKMRQRTLDDFLNGGDS